MAKAKTRAQPAPTHDQLCEEFAKLLERLYPGKGDWYYGEASDDLALATQELMR